MIENGTQIGEYRVDGLLGQGGMAEVYKAWQTNLERYEALKVLSPRMAGDPDFVKRFLKEARTAANLQHTNIAAIHTVSSAGAPQPFFTMELLAGGDLSDLIADKKRLPLEEALPILQQIASALDFAHSHRLIHRDIKPANILLKPEGDGFTVKVVDFGISKAIDDNGGTRLTQTGMFIGTPEYMSPEQAENGTSVDARTDQYSLAIVAYEMLCGAPPFRSEGNTSVISVMLKHVRDEPLPPSQLNASLSPSVDAAILKALAKNPANRFDSCAQFVAAMSSVAPIETVIEQPTIEVAPPIEPRKSTFPLIPVVIFIVMAGAGLIGYGVLHAGSGTTPIDNTSSGTISGYGGGTTGSKVPPQPTHISVPYITGASLSVAQDTLAKQSLTTNLHYRYSDNVPAQQIIRQSPAAGSSVNSNSPVAIFVSKGKPPFGAVIWPSPGAPQYTTQLSYDDLYGKNAWSLDVMRNSIYARYGRSFHRSDLQTYFKSQSWYHYNPNFKESLLTDVERHNAALILKYQKDG